MAERGRLSESQIAIKGHLEAGGHGYHCSSDYRDVIETMKGWGVVRSAFMCSERRPRSGADLRGAVLFVASCPRMATGREIIPSGGSGRRLTQINA